MQGNLKWIVIGAIILVLFVVFGRSPTQERYKAYEAARAGKDPLMLAIQEHNSKKTQLFGGEKKAAPTNVQGALGTPYPVDAKPPQQELPHYLMKPPVNPFQDNYGTKSAPKPPAQNGYYPPPPLPPGGNKPSPSSQLGPHSGVPQYLANGKPVYFMGINVYTVDADGDIIPMPDGVYKIGSWRRSIMVRDGHKLAIKN